MLRWLGILIAIGLAGSSADAQVFKPKAKKETKAKSDAPKKAATTKQSARTSPGKKRVTTKAKKNPSRADDSASDNGPKESDKDFVKITDDDDIE
jgi:hypothetical protein